MIGRAVLLFKLGEAEKIQGLRKAIAKPADGRSQARSHVLDQMNRVVA